jgi:ABC-type hemin transport system ATPase subunit
MDRPKRGGDTESAADGALPGCRLGKWSQHTALRASLQPGCTVVLLGPSGAGKSTLVNALAGDAVASTGAIRESDGHDAEPGCAVLAAVASGALSEDRLESFRKLRAEAAYMERKSDPRAQASAVAKHKTALKTLRYHPKYRHE